MKFVPPMYSHSLRIVVRDTSCNEMYIFQKRGNIRNTSNIARAGVRRKYGSAFSNILGILHTQSMILHHPKTFADFSAASFNACLGSLTPK